MPVSEQGVNLKRYMLVPRTLIFITRGEQVLLLKGAEDKRLWSGLYNGIGGHIEQGEDILSAAYRELREETGLDDVDLQLCGISTVDTQQNPGVCIYLFKGDSTQGRLSNSSEGALDWVNISDLGSLPLVSDLHTLLPRILAMKHSDPPFFAKSQYDENGDLSVSFV